MICSLCPITVSEWQHTSAYFSNNINDESRTNEDVVQFTNQLLLLFLLHLNIVFTDNINHKYYVYPRITGDPKLVHTLLSSLKNCKLRGLYLFLAW